MWARACRIKVGQACHGWNVNSCMSETWGDWAPHKPCGAGHRIRVQGRWQICKTPTHLYFVKENIITISCLPMYFMSLHFSSPLFNIHFSFLLLAVIHSHFLSPFIEMKNISYVRTGMLLETNGPSSRGFCLQQWLCRVTRRQVNYAFSLILSQTPIIFM